MACGGEGFVLADGRTGEVLSRTRLGHAQGIKCARFRKDVPGCQFLVGTRWGNYGILAFISSDGQVLHRFQPDYVGQGGASINWRGDGEELLTQTSSARSLGLYDSRGRQVVTFGDEASRLWGKPGMTVDVVGDPRDEILIVDGRDIRVYTQDRSFEGPEVYSPVRPLAGRTASGFVSLEPRPSRLG